MPELDFHVESAEPLEYAAVPTLLFKLRITNSAAEPIRSLTLNTQIRIAANQRNYSAAEQERLGELFGTKDRWAETLRSLLWTHSVLPAPGFSDCVVVDMPVTCTYDFDVTSAKYFAMLDDGEIPLEFLFSGTMFYAGPHGLQVAQIPWDKEARFRLPVSAWQGMMEHYFPNSAWLRLRRDAFDRLYSYRVRHGLPTWEAAVERLLQADGDADTQEKAG